MKITSFKDKYNFLSNFMGCHIELDGVIYASVEHAYQAAKTVIPEERVKFTERITAGIAKRHGRKVTLRADWNDVKDNLMYGFLVQKFRDIGFKKQLIDTMGKELVEGNTWHDNYWGSCSCSKCGNTGENKLGKMLMKIRLDASRESFIHVSNLLYEAQSVGFVGSRACTEQQLKRLGMVAGWAACTKRLGVSGGCEGADQRAANKYIEYGVPELFHVHMPWPQYNSKHVVPDGCTHDVWSNKFNKPDIQLVDADLKAYAEELAAQHVTGSWESRSDAAKATLGRNALIVMGSEVLVYAINGDSAGTQHDIRMASTLGIPTVNVSDDETWELVFQFLKWEREEIDAQK